jgi:hypothetical protein
MMCEEPATIKFVEKIFKDASEPCTSNRIHIGMDEAWDLGRGKYLTKKGFKKPFDMMTEYLEQVLKLTDKLQLKPISLSFCRKLILIKTENGVYVTRRDGALRYFTGIQSRAHNTLKMRPRVVLPLFSQAYVTCHILNK